MHNFILNNHAKFKRDWAKNNTIIVIKVKNTVLKNSFFRWECTCLDFNMWFVNKDNIYLKICFNVFVDFSRCMKSVSSHRCSYGIAHPKIKYKSLTCCYKIVLSLSYIFLMRYKDIKGFHSSSYPNILLKSFVCHTRKKVKQVCRNMRLSKWEF